MGLRSITLTLSKMTVTSSWRRHKVERGARADVFSSAATAQGNSFVGYYSRTTRKVVTSVATRCTSSFTVSGPASLIPDRLYASLPARAGPLGANREVAVSKDSGIFTLAESHSEVGR